jgi:hypothetical protein
VVGCFTSGGRPGLSEAPQEQADSGSEGDQRVGAAENLNACGWPPFGQRMAAVWTAVGGRLAGGWRPFRLRLAAVSPAVGGSFACGWRPFRLRLAAESLFAVIHNLADQTG